MNTAFALMACYKSALIPLETVGSEYLGIGQARSQRASSPQPPALPRYPLKRQQQSPFVRVEELANWIDHQAAAAQKSWLHSQV